MTSRRNPAGRSRLVRDTCQLLELRGSWTPKLEAQLRHLLRVLSPPQVRAVLRAQAQGDARDAFEFFRWADRQWRYRHAPEVFDEMLSLLSRTRLHDPARRVMRLMIRQRYTVMGFLCKEKRLAEVRGLLERMRTDAGLFPDQVTYNILIHGLAKHGHADEALEFLRESEGKRFRVDEVGYSAVVHSFCLNGRMAEAKEIVSEMISKGCHPDVVTYSAVVDGFYRIREIDQARKMMKHMYKNGCKPNIVTHTALLNGLCKAEKTSEAWELLNNSGEEWWTPSNITYSVVMHGFRREGKLKESCDVVAQMLQKGFFPTTVEINLLIHALCKEGKSGRCQRLHGAVPKQRLYH